MQNNNTLRGTLILMKHFIKALNKYSRAFKRFTFNCTFIENFAFLAQKQTY